MKRKIDLRHNWLQFYLMTPVDTQMTCSQILFLIILLA